MVFRNSLVDDIIVLEGLSKEKLQNSIAEISSKNTLIDLQYAVSKSLFSPYKHHALLLVQRKA